MREIKFRAFDRHTNFTHEVWSIDFKKETIDCEEIWEVPFSDITLMQYTGLKDKNGKEIYEGDIVSHLNRLYVVSINFNGYYLQRYRLWRGKFNPSYQYSLSLFTKPDGSVESAEIIGNIYENPELINK